MCAAFTCGSRWGFESFRGCISTSLFIGVFVCALEFGSAWDGNQQIFFVSEDILSHYITK
jgi:hypothetical protein